MNFPSCSKTKQSDGFDEDEIFDDSSLMANFDNAFDETSKITKSNLNDSINPLNVSALCCDEEISGYDKLTGRTWIYPTNYPVRDYQYNIIKEAILKNTLVSLPTGLGKTFIAAVIMHNFYRWYPLGKIVFAAPTRPLVAQQIEACYNIIAMPPDDTIEMTGQMQATTRKSYWQKKRVFFATPQVIYNDMKSGICPCDKIRCLVFDEAHKARGNYAYCQIVGALDDIGHRVYRMLALSATPGSKVEDVINLVKILHITHLELRTENCIDVVRYSHAKKISTVVVQLSTELNMLKQQYIEVLDVYARRLKQLNILPHNLGNLSKGRIVMLYKDFQNRERSARHPQHNYIMKDFTLLIALYHGLELLVQHGSRVFLNFFDEHPEKSWIQSDDRLTALLERLRDDLGVNPLSLNTSVLPDGTIPEVPQNLCFGHPKFDKLKERMMYHFTTAKQNNQDTKAIVFCEYRESVNLVHCMLLQCRPLIKPQMFVGQGASVSQKQQLRVMRSFREGTYNVLVATCVGEEGLDVGSVDLIVCFDISTRSPIRLVQRCGRTGRERGGQVVILVTEGKEHQTLMDCMRQRDGLNKKILHSSEVKNSLYKLNPRMVPRDFVPQCQKMHITVAKKPDPKEKESTSKSKKGQLDLRDMCAKRQSMNYKNTSNKETSKVIITEEEFKEMYPNGYVETNLLSRHKEYWNMNKESLINIVQEESDLRITRWLEWQRTLQTPGVITHSRDSLILTELLQSADAKRFPIISSGESAYTVTEQSPSKLPLTCQKRMLLSPAKQKQTKRIKKAPVMKSPLKNNGDIRAMFSGIKSTKSYTKIINDLGIQRDHSIPTRLITLLADLTLDNNTTAKKCYICENICLCSSLQKLRKPITLKLNILSSSEIIKCPDINLIDDFDADKILKCAKNTSNDEIIDIFENNLNNNFELDAALAFTLEEKPKTQNVAKNPDNFDIGDIEDIFADSLSEEDDVKKPAEKPIAKEHVFNFFNQNENKSIKSPKLEKDDHDILVHSETFTENETENMIDKIKIESKVAVKPPEEKEVLSFFGLDSVEDVFADDDIDDTPPDKLTSSKHQIECAKITKTNDTVPSTEYPLSPSILSGRIKLNTEPTSPILSSQARKFNLSRNRNRSQTVTSGSKKSINNNNFIGVKERLTVNSDSKSRVSKLQTQNLSATSKFNESIEIPDDDVILSPILQSQRKISPILPTSQRNVSPVIFTQADRKSTSVNFSSSSAIKRHESLVILDSDSDSDTTQVYNAKDDIISRSKDYTVRDKSASPVSVSLNKTSDSSINCKRKLDMCDSPTTSHFFNKKQKIDTPKDVNLKKTLNTFFKNDNTTLRCTVSPIKFPLSLKENNDPQILDSNNDFDIDKPNLSMLQLFRRDNKVDKNKINMIFKTSPKKCILTQKRKITFDDSEDEFEPAKKTESRSKQSVNVEKYRTTSNHKRKKRKHNSFLETEAALSDDAELSGDELSDDSIGSIVDFICDDAEEHGDIHAVYLKSVKSPVKAGAFKIPELPKKYNREDILSQYVEEDAYEMDSFCIDSNVGLTQVNDLSELELAEMILENKKREKKKYKRICPEPEESPDTKTKSKPKRRQIQSDSDDDSE